MKLKHIITFILSLITFCSLAQNTVNLPPGTDSRAPASFRTLGTDTLNQTWLNLPVLGYRRFYSATELNKLFKNPGIANAYSKKYTDSTISKLLPVGLNGQILKVIADNSNKYSTYDDLIVGNYITNQAELDSAKTRFISQQEIFNTWKRFAHGGNVAEPFSGIVKSNVIPQIPGQTNSYNYDPLSNTINSTLNASSATGFISTRKLSNYTHTATLTSFFNGPPNDRDHGYDNDRIGLVIAYVEDNTDMIPNNAHGLDPNDFDWPINVTDAFIPNQHTLTVLREREADSVAYRVVYDYGKLSQKNIRNGSGLSGLFKTTSNWGGAEVDLKVVRRGDTITVYTSNFSDAVSGKGPLAFPLTFLLTADPVLEKFRGQASYGYITNSQANAQFKNISIDAGYNEIYDLRNGDVWIANTAGAYNIAAGRNTFNETPPRSFLYNEHTKKLLWLKEDRTHNQLNITANDSELSATYAKKDNTIATVATVEELQNYSGPATVVLLKEKGRSGLYNYESSDLTVDSGLVFNRTAGGYWKRAGDMAIVDAAIFGVGPNCNNNGQRIANALNSPYITTLSIGQNPNDTLYIETPIYGEGLSNKKITINGILALRPQTTYSLTQTLVSGDTTIYVANADKIFKIGDVVATKSNNSIIVGTEAGQNWPEASSGRVTDVFPNRIIIDSASRNGANIDSSAVLFKTPSIFTFINCKNIEINGGKLYGNKGNSIFAYPRTKFSESFFANTGINFIQCINVNVINLEMSYFRLHGIKIAKCNRINIDRLYSHHNDSKNLIAHYGNEDIIISNSIFEHSEYEDGLNINGTIGYVTRNITVNNIITKNNGRKGQRYQNNTEGVTVSNTQSINDGVGIEIMFEGDSRATFTNVLVRGARDQRHNPGLGEGGIVITKGSALWTNVIIDSVGTVPAMIYISGGYNVFHNCTFKNLPSSLSLGKTIIRGTSNATSTRLTNINFINIDSTKIYRNGSGTYFGNLESGTTFVMLDRPSFGSSVNRNRFGNYTAGANTTISSTGIIDITGVPTSIGSNSFSGNNTFTTQAFPVTVERVTGNSVGYSWSRPSNSRRFDMYIDGTTEGGSNNGSNFLFRANSDAGAALGNVFSVERASQILTFVQSPVLPTPSTTDNSTKGATTAFVTSATKDVVNTAGDANYTITSGTQFIKLPEITNNRTVSVPSPSTFAGRTLKIINQNTSVTFNWSITGTAVKDAAGNTITSLNNSSVYVLESDGTNWIKIN